MWFAKIAQPNLSKAGPKLYAGAVCCKAMNWLPSLRALMIFGILMFFFAAAYWGWEGMGDNRISLPEVTRRGRCTTVVLHGRHGLDHHDPWASCAPEARYQPEAQWAQSRQI